MNELIAELLRIETAIAIADLSGGAQTGARIKFDKSSRIGILVRAEVAGGGAGEVVATVKQHDAAAAGNTKVLATTNPYFTKVDGAAAALTKVDDGVSRSAFDVTAVIGGANAGLLLIELHESDLDIANGYYWVSVDIGAAAVGGKNAAAFYVLGGLDREPGHELVV